MKKVYLITGGTSGIGLSILKDLVSEQDGYFISVSRSEKRIEEAKGYLDELSKNIDFITADVTNKNDCLKVRDYIDSHYRKLDGLVNGAGLMKNGGIEGETIEEWETTMNTNLNSVFILTKLLLPLLKKGTNSSIVNISSISSSRASAALSYCVSKSGLDMLTKSLAKELGKYNIRVNAVNPGIVRSNFHFTSEVFDTIDEREEFLDEAKNMYPLGRIGEPSDISPMVTFLLSDKSSWMTGSIITIDGGRLL